MFLWGAALGIVTQFFINMEIERYTLATGETVLTGFSRSWRHWGLVFAVMVYFANLWPGWAMSSATLTTYLFGGNARFIAIGQLLVIGASLTLAPVVYVALERLIFVKVGAVATFAVLAMVFAIKAESWRALPIGLSGAGGMPLELGFALLFGAIAFAGAGGGQNLCQSNWIRDKGFGMGQYVPRLVSPLTGVEEAAGTAVSGYVFEPTPANMVRWRRWWWFANTEQLLTFTLVSIATICLTSMIAHSTLYGMPGLPNSAAFLRIEGQRLQSIAGTWFGVFFWAVGAFSLFASVDGDHRLHEPPRRRRAEDDLLTLVGGVGEPAVLPAGLGAGRDRLRDPARGTGSTARAARHLGLGRRHDDVSLFGTLDQPEPPASPGPDQDSFVSRGRADLVDGALWRAGGDDDAAADSAITG